MRLLFNIHPKQSQQRMEQTHLLILALLNFDHTIHIVFHGGSEQIIKDNTVFNKKWNALTLYGAQDFLFLNGPLENINQQEYHHLCHQADFIA